MRSALRLSALWLVLVTTVFGPLADGWAHALERDAEHGHELAISFENTDEHGDCDGWQAKAPAHDLHHDLQFEPVLDVHHADHAALCPTCSHGSAAASARSQHVSALIAAADLVWLRGPHLGHISRGSARPRAPPRA